MAIFTCFPGAATATPNLQNHIKVTAENGGLKVITPYNQNFVFELKAGVPAVARRWDRSSKAWLVSRAYCDTIRDLITKHYGATPIMPSVKSDQPTIEIYEFQADYIANCRAEAASVHVNGEWCVRIPENVLRRWFKQAEREEAACGVPQTYYAVLGLEQSCLPGDIKTAYRRAARQWHPDVCREPNAREMFEAGKEAYEILSDPISRNRYNAGLAFEALMPKKQLYTTSTYSTFIPLLRCGKLKVRGYREIGILVVEEILEWNDIVDEQGRTMTSFWVGSEFTTAWL